VTDASPSTAPHPASLEEALVVIADQAGRIRALEDRLAGLESRLNQNSSNSSKPPSTDSPFKRPPPKASTGRKPGGQPGHKGHFRRQAEPTERRSVYATSCTHCGLTLGPETAIGIWLVHQVTEVEFRAVVLQDEMHEHRCPGCSGVSRAQQPKGTEGAFGPNLEAIIATLSVRFHMSRLDVVEICRTMFGIGISVGSVQATCERISDSVASTVQAIADSFATAAVAHADETGWYIRGKLVWMWAALTEEAEYFRVDPRRNTDALKKLLGDFDGLLHSDRWKPYEAFSPHQRQLCHAHLRRDIQALIDAGGVSGEIGKKLLALSDQMFSAWHAFGRQEIDCAQLASQMEPIQTQWKELAETAEATTTGKARALGRSMLKLWPALWHFVDLEGVVPTNNEQEQAVRIAVRIRKNSYGSTSETGAQFVSRMLSIIGTARRRGVDLLDWLKQARTAFRNGLEPPPLLAPC